MEKREQAGAAAAAYVFICRRRADWGVEGRQGSASIPSSRRN